MSDSPKRSLAEMQSIALALVGELQPYCARIEIAGSIRRQRPEVGDIELVCVPRIEQRVITGCLLPQFVNELDQYVTRQLMTDRWDYRLDKNGRRAYGPKFKRLLVRDPFAALDLFSVIEPAQWGVINLIRTGPADYSRRCVTPRYKGGYLPNDCEVRDGGIYRDGALLPCPEEADVYRICGRDYEAPDVRGAA